MIRGCEEMIRGCEEMIPIFSQPFCVERVLRAGES